METFGPGHELSAVLPISLVPSADISVHEHAPYRRRPGKVYISLSPFLLTGELEICSPIVRYLYNSPVVYRKAKVLLVLCLGFNVSETAIVISRVFDPNLKDRRVSILWLLTHPGRQYAFYERSLGEHTVFFKYLEGIASEHELCRIDDFTQIGRVIMSVANRLDDDEGLLIGCLGPRVITVPVMLAAHALERRGKPVHVVVPQPLFYKSVRSKGVGEKLDGGIWKLNLL